ncbi:MULTISPECIES: ABC transporter permease [unclassified Actinotalea]|uniref:ABC transporter permease n=1 Tax=unclassified Actinotalea TaxID=2638618 RepID=UPI0015F5D9F3|nr:MULTISPECIES: ABC transporter permease [unclassified Actinotalea]
MLRLTFAQMRRSLGRLVAAGVAIGISTAFVTATLLASDAMESTVYDAVTAGYGDADLVVSDGEVDDATLATLEAVPGVRAVHGYSQVGTELTGPRGQTYAGISTVATDPALRSGALVEGTLPRTAGEIALTEESAQVVGAGPGTTVQVSIEFWTIGDDGTETTRVRVDDLTVVGILDLPSATFATAESGVVVESLGRQWNAFTLGQGQPQRYWHATAALADGASPADAQATATAALGGDVVVRTMEEMGRAITAQVTGQADQFTAVVLGFAGVSLLVAALVISNTFQVLVAQRTRTLALLRCVGADRSQLRRSVVVEALVVGSASSLVGLAVGILVVQVALALLGGSVGDVPLPARITLTPATVLLPLGIGTLVTVAAALAPAVAATRVAPLAALRPAGTPTLAERSSRLRLWAAGLLTVGGAGALVLGPVVAVLADLVVGLALGLVGGTLSFVGVVLGAVFWVPRLVGSAGRVLARSGGPAARLAAANSVRNPRRTAATSSALLIGVTLVGMMATGAATSRTSLTSTLEGKYPVDVAVGTLANAEPLPTGLADQLRAVDGVADVTELTGALVDVVDGLDRLPESERAMAGSFTEVRAVDPAAAARVLLAPDALEGLDDSHVVVPTHLTMWTQIETGDEVTLSAARPTEQVTSPTQGPAAPPVTVAVPSDEAPQDGGARVTLTAVVTDLAGSAMIVTPAALEQISPDAPVTRTWLRLGAGEDAADVVSRVTAVASETGAALDTTGAAVERAFYQQVVDTLLAVVVALLGVAVVIAVVGVANTLSLSVLERRRESATLRAIGLSRAQLRLTLAVEGMLIAGVGAAVGVLLGTLYGWAGAATLLSTVGPVDFVVPWRDLGLVLLVAVLAGLLASVLPGRSAARTSPVAALTVE